MALQAYGRRTRKGYDEVFRPSEFSLRGILMSFDGRILSECVKTRDRIVKRFRKVVEG